MSSANSLIESIRAELAGAKGIDQLCSIFANRLREYLPADIIAIHQGLQLKNIPAKLLGNSKIRFDFNAEYPRVLGHELKASVFATTASTSYEAITTDLLIKTAYLASALIPIYINQERTGVLEVSFSQVAFRWRFDSRVFLEKAADYFSINLCRLFFTNPAEQSAQAGHELQQHSLDSVSSNLNLITVETSDHFVINSVGGNPERLLGLKAEEMVHNPDFWSRVLHPSDAKKLLLKTQRGEPKELQDEFRVIHQQTGEVRAMLVSARPRFSADGTFTGWSGFAFDVTGKYQARKELLQDRQRLEALYRLSQSLQKSSYTSAVALQSLKVIVSTTQADAGFMVLCQRDRIPTEVIASIGFGLKELEKFEKSDEFATTHLWLNGDERVKILEGQDSLKWLLPLFGKEVLNWRVAQISLEFEGGLLGALFVCSKKPKFFSTADLELLDIAAGQIALSTRQAELFIAEKEQAASLAALYRLSHELSKQLTAQDVIEHSVPIIKEELACKRIWLGVLNEQQTVLTGQAGIGPGLRDGVTDLTIDLSLPHPFLDTAIKTRQSVLVPGGASAICGDLKNIFDRLEIGALALVPLVSLGQVVGLLAVEPMAGNTFLSERRRQLLDSMASEIATIILARRFESRIADNAKMKMASLLASGVAHNFNNLLQAIMGQASLIELDSLNQEQKSKVAQMIMDAASRGAKLVKQLYSFSSEASFSPEFMSIRNLLLTLKEKFEQQLGNNVKLEYNLSADSLEVKGDSSMLKQVISNLVENCREALQGKEGGVVKISSTRSRVRAGDLHSELPPGSYVRIMVEDNGVGMSEEAVARCFEPFFSTKNVDPRTGLSFSGAGLGLSAAYLIVRQHDGAIVVHSNEGKGTVFSIFLPVVTLKAKESDPLEMVTSSAGDQKKSAS